MSGQEEEVYDVIIVGGGPCGLSAAARLRENTPAALFTDEEHRRFSWINKHGQKVSLKHVKGGKETLARTNNSKDELRMLVLDSSGKDWLSRWNNLFRTYEISHLRSHMLWHVDPQDRDALLGYAYQHHREKELTEMKNCVGKEISKHAKKRHADGRHIGGKQEARVAINLRDSNDYFNPSQALFSEHCRHVADRYKLGSGMMRHEAVEDIDYSVVKGVSVDDEMIFTVTTASQKRFARTVILAVGPANTPRIPRVPSMPDAATLPHTCHSMNIKDFPDPVIVERMQAQRQTSVLVVGGGLTSAQLSDLAIRRGVTKVYHLMRGPCRIKHFDVGLEWMGKYKNTEHARFWLADSDEERLEIIKEARGGGSVTPVFHKRLKKHIASGKLDLHTETCLADAKFDEEKGLWTVQTSPPIEDLPPMDYIYFATGIQTDFTALPYLQTMLERHPIPGRGGFPCVNEDLMWKNGVPLFMVGRLAALQLGPAAPNIGGAKIGAERVGWAIEDIMRKRRLAESGQSPEQKVTSDLAEYLSGHHNMFSALAVQEE
ncbi:hypothetical protein S7711_01080 [Stachybotrys chartarum IBT 7711]|uniref:Amine oxidase n=1 Tax=Stachybotrys chartarum (strain CBS 109288 / IBT 7711) TaxID=1280523 RepID=A0A084B4D3_STACB|nr:hypothetical protein S7711_01080 [Stachybotrys chartarum IBT 7711]KFA54282.1 hypothetical protein S40293_04835 [Stachybotrys chartarum IBT 40293]KFA74382.1 hypothetical protein S40288_03987 [Stachybotrys chartarum IBT 40288]